VRYEPPPGAQLQNDWPERLAGDRRRPAEGPTGGQRARLRTRPRRGSDAAIRR